MKQKGVTLVELLLIIVAVGFLVVLLASIPNSLNLVAKSRHVSLAREVLISQIEDQRTLQYANLGSGTTNISDTRLTSLPAGSGTILIEDCDPINICKNNEVAKQVTVTVLWKDGGKDQKLELKTIIAQGGLVK